MPRVIDRSSNIVLFGLPEGDSLADLKEVVDWCAFSNTSLVV